MIVKGGVSNLEPSSVATRYDLNGDRIFLIKGRSGVFFRIFCMLKTSTSTTLDLKFTVAGSAITQGYESQYLYQGNVSTQSNRVSLNVSSSPRQVCSADILLSENSASITHNGGSQHTVGTSWLDASGIDGFQIDASGNSMNGYIIVEEYNI